ncbi:MAG TPA: S-layer homology domain-containing protein [bacterium]|nr:S-layer homology domain-containing protein [bacterium]
MRVKRVFLLFAFFSSVFAATCLSISLDYPADFSDDRTVLEEADDFQNFSQTAYTDIQPGHWAYQAVKQLSELGLLDAFDGTRFDGNQPITRYEMAIIVNQLLESYLRWDDTGTIVRTKKIIVEKPMAEEIVMPEPAKPVSKPTVKVETKKIAPPMPQLAPNKEITVPSVSGKSVKLTRTGPKPMTVPQEETTSEEPQQETQSETKDNKDTEEAKEPPKPEFEERLVKIEEKIDLSLKDIETLEKLVNTFKKELKEISSSFKKEIKDVDRVSLKNQRQIENLKEENERFRITGHNSFSWETGGPITGDGHSGNQSTNFSDNITFDIESKPDPDEELIIKASTSASRKIGARSGYFGYIEGTNSAFSLNKLQIDYSNTRDDPQNPRNFKLRNLTVGDTSAMFSPLTVYGRKMQGISSSIKINDYTINVFGARMAYHYGKFLGAYDIYHDNTNYDRYFYGINLAGEVLGTPGSMGNLSKVFMADNENTSYPGCRLGYWVDLELDPDPSASKGANTDISYQDFFCGAPEKNSVESAFFRYPILDRINLTAEYAHSTYYKPGYKMVLDEHYFSPDEDDDEKTWLLANGYEECDTDDPSNEQNCWYPSKERNEQDDAFIVMLDYSKGPISIFPLAYIKLGPEFSTKYFGLPGMDMSSMGLDVSVLPISLQSLEMVIGNFTFDQQHEHNYKFSSYFGIANETEPMYFDPGALAAGMSNQKSKTTTMSLLAGFMDKINTRTETLKIKFYTGSLEYFVSDNIKFKYSKTTAKVNLPRTCLDGDRIDIVDDQGNVVDVITGDGLYTCGVPGSKDARIEIGVVYDDQSFGLTWKTSNKADFETKFGIKNSMIAISYPDLTQIEEIITDLVPQGKYYTMDYKFSYKLTNSTDVNFSYSQEYDRMPDSDDEDKYPTIDEQKLKFGVSTNF